MVLLDAGPSYVRPGADVIEEAGGGWGEGAAAVGELVWGQGPGAEGGEGLSFNEGDTERGGSRIRAEGCKKTEACWAAAYAHDVVDVGL